ncbi:MAG: preprotein translocase subunit SecE [Flavobacteriaceae bacterium]
MKFIQYIRDSFKELRNEVTWIPFQEAQKSTLIVAIFTIIFSLAVFLTDKVFQNMLEKFFNIF